MLAYSDSLTKAGDAVSVTVTVAESVQPGPTISVIYAGSGDDIVDDALVMGATDSVWTYALTIPAGNDGFAVVTVTGLDPAGNAVVPTSGSVNTLKVDNVAPTITAASPAASAFVRTTSVSYTLGETVASGEVIWTWEENPGDPDNASPHEQALAGTELAAGSHAGLLTNAPVLVQAAAYTLQFLAVDGAGNADTSAVATVTYDTLAPGVESVLVSEGPAVDIDSTQSTDTLAFHYSGFDESVSGIALYEYAIGSTQGGSDVVVWTANDTSTSSTVTGLNLRYKSTYYVMVRATDGAGNVSDSVWSEEGVKIVDRPRLTIHVVQNSGVTDHIQIFVTDTLAMADSVGVLVDNVRAAVTEIDTFFFAASPKLTGTGAHSVSVTGFSGWGDTTRTDSLSLALAKRDQAWVASSVDRRFTASGGPGVVSEDRYLLVVGAGLMLDAVAGDYQLGEGTLRFRKPVQIRLRAGGGPEDQAIYTRRPDGGWRELPSIDEGSWVLAWVEQAGSFRLGSRTILVPQTTSLQANYPNPFNPSTRIVFDLGLRDGPTQRASVIIYNLRGQRVAALFDGEAATGRYELIWQGVDGRGASVASGIYFVRLATSSGYHMTRKMLLVK